MNSQVRYRREKSNLGTTLSKGVWYWKEKSNLSVVEDKAM